jgi:hypothetical protein
MIEMYIGEMKMKNSEATSAGLLTEIGGEDFFKIENYDLMQPFFMTIVSDSDHWMYLSSNGSLTAGRSNPELALFPYYTDDKIQDSSEITGSKTVLHVTVSGKTSLWEPFSDRYKGTYNIKRNLYKNTPGNKIIFEEINSDLGLTFRYCWMNSDRFGWIRKSKLTNISGVATSVEIVDGLQNILPYGIDRNMQGMFSTLLDAYKKCELIENRSLVLYRMSSIPVDRAEPSEALKVTTVWSLGLPKTSILLSNRQLDSFRLGKAIQPETESRGIKGAYFIHSDINLQPGETQKWYIVAEVSQDLSQVAALINQIETIKNNPLEIEADIARGTETLIALVVSSDGLQATADLINVKRHFSNTLFNIMRGGIPNNGYTVEKSDFVQHLNHCNKTLGKNIEAWLSVLPNTIDYYDLIQNAEEQGNSDLIRITLEYLPLKFSRRHGDPSRPWNLFNIKLKNDDGSPSLYYQGNWRDIFQNWEALSYSFPSFLPGIIAKFVNATTIDGYNPYKITRDGFDWELMDPSNPWSNIGYWGDHQIIYLEKLIELSARFFPGQIEKWLNQPIFTYANVPYRHKPYSDLMKSPRDTIQFDEKSHLESERKVKEIGSDGKLIFNGSESLKVNFTEKLLVPLLSKLSNFIPGAGIWMNTQRPEWNDANNALVGSGASMVTLYYMRRYISFLINLFQQEKEAQWELSEEVKTFFTSIFDALDKNISLLDHPLSDTDRKLLTDLLGEAGSYFRGKVYSCVTGATAKVDNTRLLKFFETVQKYIDRSIHDNRRPDGLYHAYNLIIPGENGIAIRYLYEMLEGQVALLSSGFLSPNEAVELLDNLRKSALYRTDQRSYILYPDRQLPRFLDKNNLAESQIGDSELLEKLVADGNSEIILKDINGKYHFNGTLNNADTLKAALNRLPKSKYKTLVAQELKSIIDLYEQVFDHQSFTGRSGTFYKYEGLGCIYWHMVSKLLLTVGENTIWAKTSGADPSLIRRLNEHYDAIREGIGSHKNPDEYGAFPVDPYSHTPSMAGVQQPGMTGQVKEDIISRMIELGISVENGKIVFNPINLKKEEFVVDPENRELVNFAQNLKVVLPTGKPMLAFSFCGVPFVYLIGESQKVDVCYENEIKTSDQLIIDLSTSRSVFQREGVIKMIMVSYRASDLN